MTHRRSSSIKTASRISEQQGGGLDVGHTLGVKLSFHNGGDFVSRSRRDRPFLRLDLDDTNVDMINIYRQTSLRQLDKFCRHLWLLVIVSPNTILQARGDQLCGCVLTSAIRACRPLSNHRYED